MSSFNTNIKCVVVGDGAVGKSSFLKTVARTVVTAAFTLDCVRDYVPRVYSAKAFTVELRDGRDATLCFWDSRELLVVLFSYFAPIIVNPYCPAPRHRWGFAGKTCGSNASSNDVFQGQHVFAKPLNITMQCGGCKCIIKQCTSSVLNSVVS